MKKVVETRQVAHLWANKSQDEARNSGGNFYFTGSRLYSYGSHFVIAMHLDDGARSIVWNADRYGNTTAKQQSHARQAMTSFQWDRTIHVPKFSGDDARQLERLHGDNPERRVPDVVASCAEAVLQAIEVVGSTTQRQNVKRATAWANAKKYEASGKALCAYVSHGRQTVKWPLLDLPEDAPLLAEECTALARKMVKGRMLERVKSDMIAMTNVVRDAHALMSGSDDFYGVQNLIGRLAEAGRYLTAARKGYKAAMGREMPGGLKHAKALAAMHTPAYAKLGAFNRIHALADMRKFDRAAYEIIAARRKLRHGGYSRRVMDVGHFVSKAQSKFETLSEKEIAPVAALLARMKRIAAFEHARDVMTEAFRSFQSAESYGLQHPGDALGEYRRAASNHAEAVRLELLMRTDKVRPFMPVAALVRSAMTAEERVRFDPVYMELAINTMRTAVAKKHAADIEAWKAGELASITLRHDGPTFARIKGDEVQTSRGASVPLAHAVRLMTIARRIIAAGGRKWENGEGPQVGGFRVNEIRADGSAVIGCHEFAAEESARMLTALSLYALANNINTEEV